MPLLSVVTAAYNEAENLRTLYERVAKTLDAAGIAWELIVVDDHSRDGTFAVLSELAAADGRVRGVRLSRNEGSHTAVLCALEKASGDCIAQVAADLQHPPEMLPELWKLWAGGAQVAWAVRRGARPGMGARLYYLAMRHAAGLKDLAGADFYLMDRRVAQAVVECGARNTSIMALISWMGFRQAAIEYNRPARERGRSGWTLEKKIKLAIDSVTSFTYLPIRLISYTGAVVALAGFVEAALAARNALAGKTVEGWASLMIAVLVIGGLQMIMLGILGEYVWRALDEARRRPRYFIEAATPPAGAKCGSRESGC
jgi:dolichol-phosphate mannosyltransferase